MVGPIFPGRREQAKLTPHLPCYGRVAGVTREGKSITQEPAGARQRWLDWATQIYPGRSDIATAAADAALEALHMNGTDEDAVAAARREVRKQFPEEASRLPPDPSRVVVVAQPISISPGQAFQLGIFAGCGFLLVVTVIGVLLSAAGVTFTLFNHP